MLNSLQKSSASNDILLSAQKFKTEFGDKFVSIEHLILALANSKDTVGKMMRDTGMKIDELKKAIQ
ncbi:MAG: Clp protease N-terminal domain-containing protein [Bacteroidales bacterium]|jgi:ATP-dependent Clp protease ATP-binding subunit ClpB|nr:Clp protease N-terminal domain-containing protein [Bacteroidales bacterium]